MLSTLLALIPAPWLAVLKRLPWRLIGYAVAIALIAWATLTVNGWRKDSNALEATETRLQTTAEELAQCTASQTAAALAYAEAAGKAETIAAQDKATAERIENELHQKVAAAQSSRRDLARRLQLHAARACPGGGAVPQPAAVAGTVSDGGEPGGTGEAGRLAEAIRSASADVFAACARDGEALSHVGPWYDEVRENRGEIR